MKIRLERKNDYFEVENLTREAFWNVYRPGCFEHLVIHKLRDDSAFVKELDYVIELDSKIIANIVYAKGKITLEDGSIQDTLIFGPVSVLPEYQKKGYGCKLINYTLELASKIGYPFILITGNPNYYKINLNNEKLSKNQNTNNLLLQSHICYFKASMNFFLNNIYL